MDGDLGCGGDDLHHLGAAKIDCPDWRLLHSANAICRSTLRAPDARVGIGLLACLSSAMPEPSNVNLNRPFSRIRASSRSPS